MRRAILGLSLLAIAHGCAPSTTIGGNEDEGDGEGEGEGDGEGEGEGEGGSGEGEGESRLVALGIEDGVPVSDVLPDIWLNPVWTLEGIEAVDVDGDGVDELIVDNAGPTIIWDLAGQRRVEPLGVQAFVAGAQAVDLDADGELELLLSTPSGASVLWRDVDGWQEQALLPDINVDDPGDWSTCEGSGAYPPELCYRDLFAAVPSDRDGDGDLDVLLLGRSAWVATQTAPRAFSAAKVSPSMQIGSAQLTLLHAVRVDDVIYADARVTMTVAGEPIEYGLFALSATGPLEVLASFAGQQPRRRALVRTVDGSAVACFDSHLARLTPDLVGAEVVLDACATVLADLDGDGSDEAFWAPRLFRTTGTSVGEELIFQPFDIFPPVPVDIDADGRPELVGGALVYGQ